MKKDSLSNMETKAEMLKYLSVTVTSQFPVNKKVVSFGTQKGSPPLSEIANMNEIKGIRRSLKTRGQRILSTPDSTALPYTQIVVFSFDTKAFTLLAAPSSHTAKSTTLLRDEGSEDFTTQKRLEGHLIFLPKFSKKHPAHLLKSNP